MNQAIQLKKLENNKEEHTYTINCYVPIYIGNLYFSILVIICEHISLTY